MKNVEDIYTGDIDHGELDEILGYIEINPNFHQEKDKDNDEYADEGNDTHDIKMDHPDEDLILNYNKDKNDDDIDKEDVDLQEWGDKTEVVDLWRDYIHNGITINHIFN